METLTSTSPVADTEDAPVNPALGQDDSSEDDQSLAAAVSPTDDDLSEEELQEFYREVDALLKSSAANSAESDSVAQEVELKSRLDKLRVRFGRTVAVRAALEVAGLGVDAMLMGAGSAGVELMQSVAYREVAATVPEMVVLEKLKHRAENSHGEAHEANTAELEEAKKELAVKKILVRMGSVAVTTAVAIVAQKAGVGVVEHVHDSLNHGAGHIVIPLTSKLGAMGGVSAATKTVARRF